MTSRGGVGQGCDGFCESGSDKAKGDVRTFKGVTTMLAMVARRLRVTRAVVVTFSAAAPWVATMNSMLHMLSFDSIRGISSRGLLGAH